MTTCARCGFDNPADAAFCGQCGSELKPAAPAPPVMAPPPSLQVPAPVPQAAPAAPQAVTSGLKVGILVATVFIPLLGLIMGAIYMADPLAEKKAVGRLWLLVGIGAFIFWSLCVCVSSQSGY
jgi:hypothetical protein